MQTLSEKYQIQATLYEGVETVIYQGQKLNHNSSIILKLLKAKYPTIKALTRLKHEYLIRQNFNHDNIVTALELENFNHRIALILEDFGGISLHQVLSAEKLSAIACIKIAIQIVKGLNYLHQNQIIHKDIKPSNIIINRLTEQVKITDFGIASKLNKETPTFNNPDCIEGTLFYMSPEQTGRMNRNLDYRSDFYSLGVTLYEMLTSQLPFQSSDSLEIVYSHIAIQPIPPKQLNPEIPAAVSEIVMKLMAKNAEYRYQSAAGILADLEMCLNQLETTGNIVDFIPGRLDVLSQLLIPQKLYGREQQVNELLAAFDRVSNSPQSPAKPADSVSNPGLGSVELMLVSGYSGIGKSAVVNEINKPITRQRGYFISGKFDQFKRNIPYAALIQAFGSLSQQILMENQGSLKKWQQKILAVLGLNGQVIIDVIPEVELIVGKQREVPQLGATESQNRFNRVFKEFLHVFACKEHPLVIFLDDLQWADSASLRLMKLLITDPDSKYLLLVGAYRDNEVNPAHPLIQAVEEIRQTGTLVNNIVLQPLDLENVTQLIAETLNENLAPEASSLPENAEQLFSSPAAKGGGDVRSLAELIYNKTGGNPFFLTQLLQALNQENLLKFDFTSAASTLRFSPDSGKKQPSKISKIGSWQWNLPEIMAFGIVDRNVVELVAGRIQQLPEKSQSALKLAACIGDKFRLDVLSIVNEKSPGATASELDSALQSGLLLPLNQAYKIPLVFEEGEESGEIMPPAVPICRQQMGEEIKSRIAGIFYRFLHDRVQQAAYSLIPESQRKLTHLKIGRLLLCNIPESQIEENIFEIVNQLNIAVELIVDRPEKVKLSQLNLIAGKKAKAATAYKAAANYLNAGLNLANSDVGSWNNRYDLMLCLYAEAVEVEYLNANFERAKALSEVALEHAKNILDRVKFYELQMQFHIQQNQMQAALDIGLEVLDVLGVQLAQERPRELSDRELYDLPEMTEPNQLAAMRILMNLCAPTYVLAPVLNQRIAFTMVDFCIKYGRSPLAAFGYGLYDLIACGLRDIDAGYRAGEIALRLLEQFDAKELTAKIYGLFYAHASIWKDPVQETLAPLLEGIHIGLEMGDMEWAGYNAFYYCDHLFFIGTPLDLVAQKQAEHLDSMFKLKQTLQSYYLNIWRRLVLKLQGLTEDTYEFHGENVTDAAILQSLIDAKNQMFVFATYLSDAILFYLLKDCGRSIACAAKASEYQGGAMGMLINSVHNFYYSLALLGQASRLPENQRKQALEQVQLHQQIMYNWAYRAPENFQHKYDLVAAEEARVLGQNLEAVKYYNRAIKKAKKQGFFQEEALANELAAEFYLACGKEKVAESYITDAYYGYIRWGAAVKVKDLESKYPFLVSQTKTAATAIAPADRTGTKSTSSDSFNAALDLGTFIKFSQAIVSEIVLEKLLTKLIKILLENAGAQKAALLLLKNNELYIEAIGNAKNLAVNVLQSIIPTVEILPVSIINYVFRTQKDLVLDDATLAQPYQAYPYIRKYQPKSLLCLPIVYQSQIQGIIYLENNLTSGVFTQPRIAVLKVLVSQAAISIVNAQLYYNLESANQQLADYSQTLEQKVEERTAELKAAQNQIIANEKLSSLGALTAGVAHELRNPLNFVNNYAESSVELTEELLEEIHKQSENLEADTCDYIKEMLTDIRDNNAAIHQHGKRAENIIRSMMQHARTDSGQRQLTDINALLKQAVQLAYQSRRSLDSSFNVTISSEYDSTIALLEVAFSDLNRAFINIIDNACYAVFQKQKSWQQGTDRQTESFTPQIWVKTQNLAKAIEIRLRDNGVGIPLEIQQKIFHPFFTTKPTGEGTGLGLSLTRDIIALQHGGTLEVESETGVYTEFIITLPQL
ncbi:ATP-binding sensor histidine kinase [Microcoleus sp. herbarium14]|uniref:trifunctional serine/threonine-protein kinase/ATP-binding protein/sensor histidine kinase n=1 Tax=Microcoleus sp. herbarium14 TaxID=3055439 RepID=UPI002FD48540